MLESVALTNPHHPERVAPSRLRRLTPRLAAHDAGGVTGGGSTWSRKVECCLRALWPGCVWPKLGPRSARRPPIPALTRLQLNCLLGVDQACAEEGVAVGTAVAAFTVIILIQWLPIGWTRQRCG